MFNGSESFLEINRQKLVCLDEIQRQPGIFAVLRSVIMAQLGIRIPANQLYRLFTMCAHSHGEILNSSKLGESLSLSNHTIRSYIDIFEQTFLLRLLHPFGVNVKKRLVKSPKLYIRDSGILHSLFEYRAMNDLMSAPSYGASWEGFVIENILSELPEYRGSFYRTSSGHEIDLILQGRNAVIAVECKASSSPELTKGNIAAINDIHPDNTWIIAPVKEPYYYDRNKNIMVAPLWHFISSMKQSR